MQSTRSASASSLPAAGAAPRCPSERLPPRSATLSAAAPCRSRRGEVSPRRMVCPGCEPSLEGVHGRRGCTHACFCLLLSPICISRRVQNYCRSVYFIPPTVCVVYVLGPVVGEGGAESEDSAVFGDGILLELGFAFAVRVLARGELSRRLRSRSAQSLSLSLHSVVGITVYDTRIRRARADDRRLSSRKPRISRGPPVVARALPPPCPSRVCLCLCAHA